MEERIEEIDVLIVGGGPAGASAALSLLNYSDHSILIAEQSDLSKIRVGEHVSGSLFGLLDYLKIDREEFEEGSFLPAYGTTTYWGSEYANTTHSIFTTEASSYQLDREKFDFKLLEKIIERGGIILPRCTCTEFLQQEDSSWNIQIKHPEEGKFYMRAKYLVDATGRKNNVGRHLGVSSTKYDTLMGAGVFLNIENDATIRQEQLLETTELGWWYTALLPDARMVVTFFTDSDIISQYKLHQAAGWNRMLEQTKKIKHLVRGATALLNKPWIRNAQTQLTDATAINNFIAIGDAAASFDPISSMGIGFSMTSAFHGAKHIQRQLSRKELLTTQAFQNDIEKNFGEYLKLRTQFYEQEQRWSTSAFWKRRSTNLNG
ncbi:lysine-epsilon-oxidase maturase LodB [Aquimarina sp. RZ0]|uniref:lysine-epsilon-oxidase maturase LodB n=1 Tax=Aquimarina sp. RZ0 TaxID=2607730 RepID=UPI0011F13E78|nr:lysine-epsilon-oxidase maturase LodB [Aquimarina sp. RZ0]KAA1245170.1 dehydrogenase [Aquimarina sp. RZ0]